MPVRAQKKKPKQGKSLDTRTRLIQRAAKHFAEHGFRGTSQRAIQRELGVNPATVNYHFGSKRDLYRAVVDAYIHDIQEEREARLQALDGSLQGRDRLHRLLYDYFYPHLRLAATRDGHAYARLLAQVQSDSANSIATKIFNETVEHVRGKYVGAIRELFPNATTTQVTELLILGVALMAIVSNWQGTKPSDPDSLAHHYAELLARYAAAGFESLLGPAAAAVSVVRPKKRANRVQRKDLAKKSASPAAGS